MNKRDNVSRCTLRLAQKTRTLLAWVCVLKGYGRPGSNARDTLHCAHFGRTVEKMGQTTIFFSFETRPMSWEGLDEGDEFECATTMRCSAKLSALS